jgi:hypothetical protein
MLFCQHLFFAYPPKPPFRFILRDGPRIEEDSYGDPSHQEEENSTDSTSNSEDSTDDSVVDPNYTASSQDEGSDTSDEGTLTEASSIEFEYNSSKRQMQVMFRKVMFCFSDSNFTVPTNSNSFITSMCGFCSGSGNFTFCIGGDYVPMVHFASFIQICSRIFCFFPSFYRPDLLVL